MIQVRLLQSLALAALLFEVAACTDTPKQAVVEKPQTIGLAPARGPVCRVGPEGGPPLESAPNAEHREAERGIGGTGAIADAQAAMLTADRGIGGTGIVGVVTGFGSICVDGVKIAYDAAVPVDSEAGPADVSQLRVGQVVTVRTAGPSATPEAKAIGIRIEAAGRIDSITSADRLWRVGGQPVFVPSRAPGAKGHALGDWVEVSGLRRTDGIIVASRVDPSPPDRLSVRGEVWLESGTLRLGTLTLPDGAATPGDWVHVAGDYAGNVPHPVTVTADTACPNPYRCYAGGVSLLMMQAYVHATGGQVLMNGMLLPASGEAGRIAADAVAVVTLQRQADGTFAVTGMQVPNPVMPVPPGQIPAVESTDPPPSPEPADPQINQESDAPLTSEADSHAAFTAAASVTGLHTPAASLDLAVVHGAASPDHGQARPGATRPGMMQPEMAQPGLVQPGRGQRGLVQPGTIQPGMVQPATVRPGRAPQARRAGAAGSL